MRRLPLVLLPALLAGCSSRPTAPTEWQLLPGRIAPALSSVRAVVAPTTVTVGARFTVTVNTVGSSSCTRSHEMNVETDGLTVALTPLNWEAPPGRPCTDDLARFPHVVELTLGTPGDATLRIHARDLSGRDTQVEVPVTVTPE